MPGYFQLRPHCHLFIAAHARAKRLTLVTNNTAEFERVGELAIENWTLPPRRRR